MKTPSDRMLAHIREIFSYDSETGQLQWKVAHGQGNRFPAGQVAGTPTVPDGYLAVCFSFEGEKQCLKAHRVCWYLATGEWPMLYIDHINGQPTDNRISNLRLATKQQNNANRKASSRCKSGVMGVHKLASGRWCASISKGNGSARQIGIYATKEEAGEAYFRAAQERYGEFACYPFKS